MLEKTIEDLVDFVRRERNTALEEHAFTNILSEKALVNLGYAIEGLYVVKQDNDTVILACQSNESRFRPGDRLSFTHANYKPFSAILIKVENGGCELHCKIAGKSPAQNSGPWLANEDQSNLSTSIINALQRLQPGAPGWGLVKKLFGEDGPAPPSLFPKTLINAENTYKSLTSESNCELDISQLKVFKKCLELPDLLGVQGPPGTGKTMLLGFVAGGLINAGKRILILAPTHQAVNNALSTIRNLFPNRPLRKVGDDLRTESLHPSIPIISSNAALKEVSVDTVVGMTFLAALNRLMLGDQRPFSPNVVIIDEAGQLPLTQGTCTALCGAGTILFFGDDRQMPPVFSGEISDDDLAISVFAQLRKSQPDLINMLSITHRLNQELCQHISNSFYADSPEPLHSSNLARDRRLEINGLSRIEEKSIERILGPTNSLVWVEIVTDKYMQSNEPEASMVARLVETCLKSGMQPAEIAVVTPFRRQARLIYNILNNIFGNTTQLPIVDTVERVQGATVDLVIFSFCASQSDYVGSLSNFLFSPNRLNVALSRARRKSIFLSSPNIFTAVPLEHKGIVGRNRCRKLLENADDSICF